MPRDNRSFSRRTVLKASTASVGGLMAVGTASADESEEVFCPSCIAPYDINDIQIERAVPPSVTGSVTLTKPCVAAEGRVEIFVDDVLAHEELVNIDCTEEVTADFEYAPDRPLKPGTYELRVAVTLVREQLTTEETTQFQIPSGQGRGRGKGRSKGKGKGR